MIKGCEILEMMWFPLAIKQVIIIVLKTCLSGQHLWCYGMENLFWQKSSVHLRV